MSDTLLVCRDRAGEVYGGAERHTSGTSDQVEASTPWSALARQRLGPTDLSGPP